MLTCREAAEIATSKDVEQLSWVKRTSLRLHMFLCDCPHCAAFGKQLVILRDMARRFRQRQESNLETSTATLPEEVKERIVEKLKQ